ncbi:hypothetical protein AQJ84_02015 [Streptomyces resistomycificus]|nr:hypothetical protein AQJ84_02015 [Streptomyces resistomycificus]
MRIPMLAVVTATAALLFGTGATAATAAPGSDTTRVSAASAGQPFADQAAKAHLTKAQTTSLQAKVDRYVKRTGGKQVALNEIDLGGDATLMVALPGEKHPRDFASGDSSRAAFDPCLQGQVHSGWFCAYSREGFNGDALRWYECGRRGMPWGDWGSWINDQTPGTRAIFFGADGSAYDATPAPYSSNSRYYWTPVWSIKNC